MRWRKSNYKTWQEIRQELPDVIRKIDEGWTYWFDLHQSFDSSRDYALVVGYNEEEELAIVIASESSNSVMHEYCYDWVIPLINEDGDCWDTEQIISKEDADRPDFMDMIVDEFQNEWLAMVAYFTRKNYLEEEASMYKPEPINTTNVVLPEEITELTEKLAESTHDKWAENRLEQGWTYGEKRDDDKKLHPCLIPYEDLPDSEKKYDRDTAMETLKAVYALGYKIVKEEN